MTALVIIVVALVAFIIYLLFYPRKKKPFSHLPYLEALAALLESNDELAMRKLKEAVNMDSNLVDAYIKLGNLYRKKGDKSRAIQIHQSLTVRPTLKKEEEKKVYYALVEDHLADDRPNKAVSFLKEILKIDKRDRRARQLLLEILENLENYPDCITVYEEGDSEGREDRRRAFYYAATGNGKLKEITDDTPEAEKEALNNFRKALKIYPDSLAGSYFLAEYFKTSGDLKKAREHYIKIASRYPESAFLIQPSLEKVLYDLGSFDEVIPLYDRIFSLAPKNFVVGFALASLYEKKNEIEAAKEVYRKLADLYPRSILPRLRTLRLSTEDKYVKKDLGEIERGFAVQQFQCRTCSFNAGKYSFICPKCHSLESFFPSL